MKNILLMGVVGIFACENTYKTTITTTPTIESISISPDERITTSSALLCFATAQDDKDQITLSYQWTDGDGNILADTGIFTLTPDIVRPNDELTCTATATDGENSVSEQASVTIENTLPTISNITITPQEVFVNSLIECTFETSDTDQEELSVVYSWTHNEIAVGSESSLQLVAENVSDEDVIVCTVTVEDGYGGTASGSTQVVVGNTKPAIGSTSLAPDPSYSYDALTCLVNDVTDLEGEDVTISYEWTMDGEIQTETTNTLTSPHHVGSEITCRATPNDGKIDGDSSEANTVIINSLPSVSEISIDNGVVFTNDVITANAIVADADDEHTPTVTYEWHVVDSSTGGVDSVVQSGDSHMLDGAQFFDKDDSVYVIATPNDGLDGGLSLASTPVVTSNSQPTNITAGITSSDSFHNDSTLTCSASASDIDPEDATLTYEYIWSTGSTGAELVLDSSMVPGSDVTCSATATDTSGASISVDATEALVNRAPVATITSFGPDPASTSDTLSVSASITDEDINNSGVLVLSYAWFVDNAVVSGEQSATLDYAYFTKDQTVRVEVMPSDGEDAGSMVFAELVIENTSPSELITEINSIETNRGSRRFDLYCNCD